MANREVAVAVSNKRTSVNAKELSRCGRGFTGTITPMNTRHLKFAVLIACVGASLQLGCCLEFKSRAYGQACCLAENMVELSQPAGVDCGSYGFRPTVWRCSPSHLRAPTPCPCDENCQTCEPGSTPTPVIQGPPLLEPPETVDPSIDRLPLPPSGEPPGAFLDSNPLYHGHFDRAPMQPSYLGPR